MGGNLADDLVGWLVVGRWVGGLVGWWVVGGGLDGGWVDVWVVGSMKDEFGRKFE